jgi:hypothetical protein
VILLYPLVLGVAATIVVRRRAAPWGRGWHWFSAWAAAGATFTFSLLTGLSIGLLVLPFAAALLLVVATRSPHVREALGFVLGVGAVLLLIAFVNRDYRPCPSGGLSIPPGAPAGTSVSCGGVDPEPWLWSGVVVATIGVAAYALARRLTSR